MTFLIHGATGAQGAPVIAALTRNGLSVVAAVRNPDRYEGPGAAIALDLADTSALEQAYRDTDGVFVHLPVGAPDQQLEHARAIVSALDRARPERVVVSTSGAVVDAEGAIGVLVRGVIATGISTAVVAPRLYLENLLLPTVLDPVRSEGVLPYPIRSDYPVSWSSHLDVAEVVSRLLQDAAVTGTVGVGAVPGLVGLDLAAGFAQHFGRDVRFKHQDPADFRKDLEPIFGVAAADAVSQYYGGRLTQSEDVLDTATSAQAILGLTPRSIAEWLRDVGV